MSNMLNNLSIEARSSYAVQLKDVNFSYNQKAIVLNNCSLNIVEGGVFALLGSNGCGKTSILKLILGSIKPNIGLVRVFGLQPGTKNCNIPGPGVGYMPQEISLFLDMKLKENLIYFAKVFHMNNEEFYERFKHLTELLNLSEKNRIVGQLSGGQQRLLSLAIALLHKPPLLILDEPTVGVDPILRSRIWNHLDAICRENGNTVLITTHYIEEAKKASTVGFMKSGAILRQENPQKLMDEYQCQSLETVFLKLWRQNKIVRSVPPENSDEQTSQRSANRDYQKDYTRKYLDYYRVLALIWKFYLRSKMYPILLIGFIAIPFLSVFSVYLSIGHLPHDIPVAIYTDEPMPDLSKQLIDSFDTRLMKVCHYKSKDSAIRSLSEGKNSLGIFFGHNFTDDFESRLLDPWTITEEELDSSMIKLQVDMSQAVVLIYGFQYLSEVVLNFVTNVSTSLGLNPKSFELPIAIQEPIYGSHPITAMPRDKYRSNYEYIATGFLISSFHLSAMVFSAFVVINNRRGSQMNRFMVCGGTQIEIIIAHYISLLIFIITQIFILLLCSEYLFDIKQEGSYVEVFLICFIQSLQGLSFGFLFGIMFRSEMGIIMAIGLINAPVWFVSGLFWPLEGVPTYFRFISDWTPISQSYVCLRSIMLRGWDYTHPKVMTGYLVSSGYTLVSTVASVILFQIYPEPFWL